jgi:hypothetical protein
MNWLIARLLVVLSVIDWKEVAIVVDLWGDVREERTIRHARSKPLLPARDYGVKGTLNNVPRRY